VGDGPNGRRRGGVDVGDEVSFTKPIGDGNVSAPTGVGHNGVERERKIDRQRTR